MTNFPKRILVILSLVAVCCFAFAAVASADTTATLTVAADGNTVATCVYQDDVCFTFEAVDGKTSAWCLVQPDDLVKIDITLPSGVTPDVANRTIPVKIQLSNGEWVYSQPTASVNSQVVTLILPALVIDDAENVKISNWIIGDVEQNLNADILCVSGGFSLLIDTHCGNITATDSITWLKKLDVEFLQAPYTAMSCDKVTVTGRVYDICGDPFVCEYVEVWISEACDECGEADGCDGPALTGIVRTITGGSGSFTATLTTPDEANLDYNNCNGTTPYKINVKPVIDPDLYCEQETKCTDLTLEPNAPAQLQWAYLNSDTEKWEPVCDGLQMAIDQCQPMRVYLLDSCGVTNACDGDIIGNVTKATVDRQVYLTGIESQSDTECVDTVPPLVGAHFYLPGECDGNQINQIIIPTGSCYAEVEVQPLVDGYVKLTARSDFPAALTPDSVCAHIYDPMSVELVGTALVTDDEDAPRGGWVYQEAIWLGEELCECADNMSVMVEFQNADGLTATWSPVFNDTYDYTAPYVSGDTYSFGAYKQADNECKSHFYIYTHPFEMYEDPCGAVDECGDPIIREGGPDCSWTGSLEVRVKITCATTGITYASGWQTIDFATPLEGARHLAADKWQIISTPKTLAGTGDMNFLLGAGNVKAAYYYDNGTWTTPTVLKPLTAYYVRTAQADCNIQNQEGYYATYIFKRSNTLGGTIPPTKTLVAGWNLVSPAAGPGYLEALGIDVFSNQQWMEIFEEFTGVELAPCYLEFESACEWLGTTSTMCKKLYNPGDSSGNLAPFNNLTIATDSLLGDLSSVPPVFNGDGYWLWTAGEGTLVADTALDLIKQ